VEESPLEAIEYDPSADQLLVSLGKLLFRRHVRICADGEFLKKRAFLGFSGDNDGAVLSPFEDCLWSIQLKTALLFDRAMALNALYIKQGLNLGCPKSVHIRPQRR
jgi:hypothetical protein